MMGKKLKIAAVMLTLMATGARAASDTSFHDQFAKAGLVPLAGRDGEQKDAAPPSGQALIVQFWASWCVGCRPAMEASVRKLDASAQKVRFISISLDDDPAAAKRYLKPAGSLAERLTAATFVDTTQKLAGKLKIQAVPATLFVNPDGTIAGQVMGHSTPAEFDRLLQQISQAH